MIGLDLAALLLGYLIAGTLRTGHVFQVQSLRLIGVMIPTFIGVAFNNGAYSIVSLERPGRGIAKAFEALMFSVAAVIALLFYLKVSTDFSRLIFGIGTVFGAALLALSRWCVGNWAGRSHNWSFENTLVLVDGITVVPRHGEVIVFADEIALNPAADDPSILDKLSKIIRHCERVVVACPQERRVAWAHMLKGCAIDVEIVSPELLTLGAVGIRTDHDRKTLVVSSRPLGLRDRAMKRALDLAIAVSAIILFGPLMLVMAALIKLSSRGPVMFKQDRMGLNNHIFKLLKFRSMRAGDSDLMGLRSTSRDDERLTELGKFLRKTSLDELPQLFNVLAGDMSIVGPRPHALGSMAEARLFWHIEPRYFHRHAMKPGMTGLAQVRGYRGATVREADLTNRLQSDLEYLAGWTIWRDFRIIARTFKVLTSMNAY
ncbi:exopolysaccharide biosynthesis polyprenyl glycosylphosphotransferase [Sphingomonas sp. URHD0057]|uniref:exopolysaccharide biosynthesis polyprenyl glycosylphosphotransferase n=1 Tax=Sphingomonas sp. URHD0057 TaxID=1380389 RepID=UPI0018CC555E|nr:exopolysaccharide biosynthesis polyprenyl glycosylphosphotransferase [Sphingomonas sp. URHD0057]